ncbi:S9 family peptidase [Rhodocista pekingensis]|uniref:S9 family peptidase n=1 Tax=Rhodocista pekingensis TaxID=201185 RepID=A0ABW2KV36_9PROT
MRRRQFLTTSLAAGLLPLAGCAAGRDAGSSSGSSGGGPVPPRPPKRPKRIVQLGRVRIDDYAWLRDPDWARVSRDTGLMDPEIRAHLDAENAYAEAMLAPTRERQAVFARRMLALAGTDAPPQPVADGPWEYYEYVRPGEDHPVHARRPRGGGAEQVLLDAQARARGHAYFRLAEATHSPDHGFFLWAEDVEGGDRHRICVRDLTTGRVTTTPEADAYGYMGVVFSPCSQYVFWIWRDPFSRPMRLYRRPSRGGEDVLVYEETDPALFMAVRRTASDNYVVIHTLGPDLDEIRLIPAATPTAAPLLVEPRQPGLHYQVEDWDGALVILTDADGAVDGKLMRADPARPGRAHWREWLPHRPGRHIMEIRPFRDHFVRLERVDARPTLIVTPRGAPPHGDALEDTVTFPEAAYALTLPPVQEHDGAALRLVYQSPHTPPQTIDYDMAARTRRIVQAGTAGAGFSPDAYEVRRLDAPAADGALVPVTVLMRKGTRLDGRSPLLLYGYGAYGISSEAEFSVPALALVEQGWIYAIAHVRGGSERGQGWLLDGRRFKKRNSFTDFIAVAETLIAQGYTARKRIVAYGLSAGGLLMGGVLNLRPDLWGGAIAQVPFVDMLNTMSDADHPLVPAFRPDWGDPLADPEAYDYIASISPYENVRAQPYPPVLATAGIRDDRVSYWEAAKWVAALREKTTGTAPVLFRIDMAAGHQSAAGLSDRMNQMALFWAFAEWSLTQG